MDLGRNNVKVFSRIALACILLSSLTACHRPCETNLYSVPELPSDLLVRLQKPFPAYQQREYDLCLLKKARVQVIRVGQTWTFVLPSDELFDNDTSEIQKGYEPVLAVIANFIHTYHSITVRVQSFSDKPPVDIQTKFGTVTDELTARQSAAVVENLTARNTNARFIVGEGLSAKDPVAWDGTRVGRQLNRRVEIHFRYYHDDTAWY